MRSKTFHPTVMEEAFKKVHFIQDSPLVQTVLDALVRRARTRRSPDKPWDANLSFRTYKQLSRNGVLQ